jgi:hypothetical protein
MTKNSLKIPKKRNQKPYIEERQTMQFLEEEKDKQRSTKTHTTKGTNIALLIKYKHK